MFLIVDDARLVKNKMPFLFKGVALVDDATLWYADKVTPTYTVLTEDTCKKIKECGFNAVRLVLKTDYIVNEHGKRRPEGFDYIDTCLDLASACDLGVVLDMHIPTGGALQDFAITDENKKFWSSVPLQDLFIRGWELLAQTYHKLPSILAFELLNEPAVEDNAIYWGLIHKTVAAIRRHDTNHVLAIQADNSGHVEKIDDENYFYFVHMYDPVLFTLQNARWNLLLQTKGQVHYPGSIQWPGQKPEYWDRDAINKKIASFKNIQDTLHVPVVVGEFGVITSAPAESAHAWMIDVCTAIKKYKLSGYIYWRFMYESSHDLIQPAYGDIALLSTAGYRNASALTALQ